MNTSSFSLFVLLAVSLLTWIPHPTQAQTTAPVQQQQQYYQQAPQKRSFLSRFRRAPRTQQQQQPQAVPQAQQQQQQQPTKRGFSLRLPKFKKPNIRMPRLDLSKVRMPKVKTPKLKWPFGGRQEVKKQVMNYPNAVQNQQIGGAYGIVTGQGVKFYEIGPSQPLGPDERLAQGTLVTIRSNDRSWAYVTLKDQRSGYIGLDQVRFAAPQEVSRAQPKTRSRSTKKSTRSRRLASNSGTKKKYTPPALPKAAADLEEASEPEVNPLLGAAQEDEPEVAQSPEPLPVDSPEVLFDPILDPLEPIPGDMVPSAGPGPEPFLSDPIPSIEEELRAIREAKEAAGEDDASLPSDS